MFEKLADLVPMRFSLASLTPGDGLLGERKDLTALGYDGQTAVYDISARAVYLPSGTKLEAHSGLGGLMDNPAHVDQRMVGATPPNVYDLKPTPDHPPLTEDWLGPAGLVAAGWPPRPSGPAARLERLLLRGGPPNWPRCARTRRRN